MSAERQRYLSRRALVGPWRVEGETSAGWSGAVVIPACDEDDWLFATLDSLAANPPPVRERFLVVIVVNQTAGASAEVAAANQRTLVRLRAANGHPGLALAWIDAASPGLELPGGPGPPRRLGLDRALAQLGTDEAAPLVCLDADTLVDANYLNALLAHFATPGVAGGAVLPYAHQSATSPSLQLAIDRYELYLRCYTLGLQLAGSPYAFHTIGSAMACSARAYVRCGGMNQRCAAEDFYFLQALAKTDGVVQLTGTCVYPSARPSARVIFGTGPALNRLLIDGNAVPAYPVAAFILLRDFFIKVTKTGMTDGEGVQAVAEQLHSQLGVFCRQQKLVRVCTALTANNRSEKQQLRAFHGWFDSLKTLRLLRFLAETADFSQQPVEQAAVEFLSTIGVPAVASLSGLLQQFREIQNTA